MSEAIEPISLGYAAWKNNIKVHAVTQIADSSAAAAADDDDDKQWAVNGKSIDCMMQPGMAVSIRLMMHTVACLWFITSD